MLVMLAIYEAKIRVIKANPGNKFLDPIPTNKKLDIVTHNCHPSCMGNVERRVMVRVGPGIDMRSYSKNS
jgi:hypothetical protein